MTQAAVSSLYASKRGDTVICIIIKCKSWQAVIQGRDWAPESGRWAMDHGYALGAQQSAWVWRGCGNPAEEEHDVKIKAQKPHFLDAQPHKESHLPV